MEALIIIGLTDTVVQFGKSAQEVWSESIAARQRGGPKSVPGLRGLVSHLTGQAGFLYTYINATRTRQEHPQETQVCAIVPYNNNKYPLLTDNSPEPGPIGVRV
jgi:hypothetical protein